MKTISLDEKKSEAFSEKLLDTFNQGAVALMISLGHRSGLFDTMSRLPGSTSEEIAHEAGLQERYVREWLGAMATGRVVEYDAERKTYTLPAEHAAWLCRQSPKYNMAVLAQYIPLLGSVEEEVLKCFFDGGGVPYEAYERFHEVMAEDSGQSIVSALVDEVLPLLGDVRECLQQGVEVLDIGCGAGRALMALAGVFPQSRFRGYDLCDEAVRMARSEAEKRGLKNIHFEVRDVVNLREESRYDFIMALDSIHDQARPGQVLLEIQKALRPEGTFLMQDIAASSHVHKNMDHPIGPLLYTVSCMHCMTVSLARGGDGLGAVWGRETAERMVKEAGFGSVEVKKLPHDIQNFLYVIRK